MKTHCTILESELNNKAIGSQQCNLVYIFKKKPYFREYILIRVKFSVISNF